MLSWIRKHPWLAALVAVGAVLTLLFIGSLCIPLVRDLCQYNEYTKKPDCAQHHLGPWVVLWVIVSIQDYNGFVTATATIVMAVFTGTLWFVTNKSVGLARDEFNASHRPQLDVRVVRMLKFEKREPISIAWCVVNIGTGRGRIVESNATVKFATEPLPVNPQIYSEERAVMNGDGQWINPGFSANCTWHFHLTGADWVTFAVSQENDELAESLYFVGYVLYEAGDGQRRSVAFCRRYDPTTERFAVVDDPAYEHFA